MSDLVVTVRQISNYPNLPAANGTENLLVQQGGVGGPYATIATAALVSTALNTGGSLGVGTGIPADASSGHVFTATNHVLPLNGTLMWNSYWDGSEFRNWGANIAAFIGAGADGFTFSIGTAAGADQPSIFTDVMSLTVAGHLTLPLGTLTVARDPSALMDVATLNWVSNNTVASFNNRIGRVTLTQGDVYGALQLDSAIATQTWSIGAINAAIGDFVSSYPLVTCWNGRTGNVYLTLSDITCVFYQPGQQPISPTPALTSNDDSIATTKWVTEYIANEFAGGGGNLATQSWVLANTVNSFNGRRGVVTLTSADVFDVGAAPLNSPNFSGVPTAPTAAVGQATGQIATTAFVQQAISANTAGVSTFNTRTGDVVLTTADVTTAGGITNPSANLTGAPTAPTAAPGTSSPQIANTQFVMAAIGAAVTSFNTRTGAITLTTADITGAGGAPLVSPNFSSVPTAPTAAPGTNTVQLATCAFVTAALNTAGGVSSFNGRTGAVDLIGNDISAAGGLVNPSVTLTGTPTAPTAPANTNSQQIATTAFVAQALSAGTVTSFNTRTGAIVLTGADIQTAGGALLASPNFTGAPTAPTAPANTNNTQLATTQFVMSAILADTTGVTSFNTRTGAVSLTLADITGAGGAPSASPQFTGIPQAPTATAGTNTTQLATTQFVQSAIASSGVASFNARTGAVTLIANDISAAGGALVASPIFTGIPSAPTAAPGTNSTQLATTQFVATSYAPLASPALTGTPTAPTAAAATNNTQIATTAFVHGYLPLTGGQISGSLGVGLANTVPSGAQAGTVALSVLTSSGINYAANAYYDGTTWRRTTAGTAGLTAQATNGEVDWYSAPSGAAGSAITWANILQLTSLGGVNVSYNGTGDVMSIITTTGHPRILYSRPGNRVWSCGMIGSSSDFRIADETGGLVFVDMVPGSGGAVNFQQGRIISQAPGNNPSITFYDPTQGAAGLFYGGGGHLYFANMNGDGTFASTFANFDGLGNLSINGTLAQGSDAALKENVAGADDYGLDQVMALRPKRYNRIGQDQAEVGFIAQEVEPVLPEAVSLGASADDKPGILSLAFMPFLAALVNGMKQLAGQVSTLRERIEALEARMAEMGA